MNFDDIDKGMQIVLFRIGLLFQLVDRFHNVLMQILYVMHVFVMLHRTHTHPPVLHLLLHLDLVGNCELNLRVGLFYNCCCLYSSDQYY